LCGQPGELRQTAYGDAEAMLHSHCQRPWSEAYEAVVVRNGATTSVASSL